VHVESSSKSSSSPPIWARRAPFQGTSDWELGTLRQRPGTEPARGFSSLAHSPELPGDGRNPLSTNPDQPSLGHSQGQGVVHAHNRRLIPAALARGTRGAGPPVSSWRCLPPRHWWARWISAVVARVA
jgi:hypothetical protein